MIKSLLNLKLLRKLFNTGTGMNSVTMTWGIDGKYDVSELSNVFGSITSYIPQGKYFRKWVSNHPLFLCVNVTKSTQ